MRIINVVPKRVDHEMRKRQITDAVVHITVKGGLAAATFREVAAEAGVSVRLVQYYFGTKDQLLLETQRHVAERSIARIRRLRAHAKDPPRDILRTIMRSFVPADDESRDAMLMYIELFTASLLDPMLKRKEAGEVPDSMRRVFAQQLQRANLRAGVDAEQEALILVVIVTGLSQGVLDGQITPADAFESIDYALDRALRT
jgi:TetR/AcrR family transcriptional regulator, transcriptional repressor of bet genes